MKANCMHIYVASQIELEYCWIWRKASNSTNQFNLKPKVRPGARDESVMICRNFPCDTTFLYIFHSSNHLFWWRFYVVTSLFGLFCGCSGFCHRTESDLFLFLSSNNLEFHIRKFRYRIDSHQLLIQGIMFYSIYPTTDTECKQNGFGRVKTILGCQRGTYLYPMCIIYWFSLLSIKKNYEKEQYITKIFQNK